MGIGHVSRRKFLIFFGAAAASPGIVPSRAADAMTMHKSATCGCCGKWAARMREAGFTVKEVIEPDMSDLKSKLGVPKAMQSCHTARIDGYVVEGHVPADAIHRMLAERPGFVGVAAPGMPAGSPGMEGGEAEVYQLYLFNAENSREFGKWRGTKPA